MNPNYLALDIGEKRIGIAVGAIVPFGRGVINVTESSAVEMALRKIVDDEQITAVVIGIPYVKSGEVTKSQALAQEWATRIESLFHLPITLVDESYTSVEAERQLRAMGVDTEKEKWRIDERSAELILSHFLAEQRQ